jgi:TM2 domain-containing membrane protein YozV
MKKINVLVVLLFFAAVQFSNANSYKLDNSKVDAMFATASEISATEITNFQMNSMVSGDVIKLVDNPEPLVAWLCTWTGYFLVCGIHRLYLGTSLVVFIVYLLTLGGCEIVQTVDWVVLLLELINKKNFDKYVGNTKILMWL